MDVDFVLALPFHHGDLEPDCVEVSTRGAYARDKNTSARLCAKNAGGAYARGGAYLRDTTVLVLHCVGGLKAPRSVICSKPQGVATSTN